MAKKDKVIVTGATGFVGTHLCRRLVELGPEVHSMSLSFGDVPGVTYHLADLSSPDDCVRVISRVNPDFVFHLAAQPLVGTAFNSAQDTFETNIRGAYNLIYALDYFSSVRGVVWMSSDKAFGSYNRPVKETDELRGFGHPYDVSKLCGDVLAKTAAVCYDLPVVIVRSGNIYGPGDNNSDRIIPETILSTLDGDPVQIRSDGKFSRDYIYIDDIVQALLLSLVGLLTKKLTYGEAVNFGSIDTVSVIDLVDDILRQMGRLDLTPKIENTERNEIPYQHLDWTKAQDLLNWFPQVQLDEGLRRTIAWYKEKRHD